jgi:transglutaminase-like putative cysteine protease
MVYIHTIVDHIEGDFENLRIFLKSPRSDLRQKVEFIGANHRFKENQERWSNIYDFELTKESFDSRNQARVNIILNIDFSGRNPYRVSNDTPVSNLPLIWDDVSDVKDYLEAHDFVEVQAKEIQEKAKEFREGNPGFWPVVRKIANWINTYVVYAYDLRQKEYRGALETLRSRRGTCSDFVHLFLALARNLNIPARAMVGLHRVGRKWETHSWAEVYDPEYEWTPIDLVSQPVNLTLGSNYIGISAGYNCAVRFYAFYKSEKESPPVNLKFRQYYIIGNRSVEIEFFDE